MVRAPFKNARQSHEAGGAKTFVAVDDADGETVLGFYSLAPGALADKPLTLVMALATFEAGLKEKSLL